MTHLHKFKQDLRYFKNNNDGAFIGWYSKLEEAILKIIPQQKPQEYIN